MKLSKKETISYGLGAVGKDMVYMLSASYVLYYYQDILGVSAVAMGVILLVARIFDAFNDPFMGVIVEKTKTRWGKFRPWLMIGTLLNAVILFLMFAAPPALSGSGLVAYAAVFYILWGVTYTMMDIPFWSMIPAFTESGKRESDDTGKILCRCGIRSDYRNYHDCCTGSWEVFLRKYGGSKRSGTVRFPVVCTDYCGIVCHYDRHYLPEY